MEIIDIRSNERRGEVCYAYTKTDCVQIRHDYNQSCQRVKQNMGIKYNDYFLSYVVPNAWVGHITESNKAFESLTRCSGMT